MRDGASKKVNGCILAESSSVHCSIHLLQLSQLVVSYSVITQRRVINVLTKWNWLITHSTFTCNKFK